MTQVATTESVIGDFDTTLSVPGLSIDLRRDGDQFYFDQKILLRPEKTC